MTVAAWQLAVVVVVAVFWVVVAAAAITLVAQRHRTYRHEMRQLKNKVTELEYIVADRATQSRPKAAKKTGRQKATYIILEEDLA